MSAAPALAAIILAVVAVGGCIHGATAVRIRVHTPERDDVFELTSARIAVDGVPIFDSTVDEQHLCEELFLDPRPPGCTSVVFEGAVEPGLRRIETELTVEQPGLAHAITLRAHAWILAQRGRRQPIEIVMTDAGPLHDWDHRIGVAITW